MGKPRLTDHMKQRYELHYEELQKALSDNIELPLAVFCRERDIDARSFTSWLNVYKKLTPLDVRNKIRVSQGMSPVRTRGQLEYDKHLQAYRDMLSIDLDYPLTQYCQDVGIASHGFHHWLMRKGMSVEKIRQEICAELDIEVTNAGKLRKGNHRPKPTEPRVFRKAVAGYKKALEHDPELSMQKFCRAKGYAYRPLLRWMNEVGIKPADIKAFVKDRNKLPKDNRRVFIQFKPNGGATGDQLNGVRIGLPDGTQIDVESCTVGGLCSFVNIYAKQNEV